jgi:hypothetical protein|tara:strand:+ start:2416 stop:2571 length:156 start_codon:yes stop_codon:yes gene_type:complete
MNKASLTAIIQLYEDLLRNGRIPVDGPAYTRMQKLKLQKLLRRKTYGAKNS